MGHLAADICRAASAAAPQVSTRDHLIPPAMQFELADKLHAKTVTFPAGEAPSSFLVLCLF
jgi:hypothetical protein